MIKSVPSSKKMSLNCMPPLRSLTDESFLPEALKHRTQAMTGAGCGEEDWGSLKKIRSF